MLDVLLITA